MAEKLCELVKGGSGTNGIDYSNPITISTSGQTASASGLLVIQVSATSGYGAIQVNNLTVASIQTFGNYGGFINTMVSKGDNITFSVYGTSIADAKIYPYK